MRGFLGSSNRSNSEFCRFSGFEPGPLGSITCMAYMQPTSTAEWRNLCVGHDHVKKGSPYSITERRVP